MPHLVHIPDSSGLIASTSIGRSSEVPRRTTGPRLNRRARYPVAPSLRADTAFTQEVSMRFTLAVATALVFAGVPSPAQAAEPTHGPLGPFTAQLVIADECPFVVHELATFSGSVPVWYGDDTTTPVRFNAAVVETDVFSANGKTLTTEPYHYSSRGSFDAAGQQTT